MGDDQFFNRSWLFSLPVIALSVLAVIPVFSFVAVLILFSREPIGGGTGVAAVSVGIAVAGFPWTIAGRWNRGFRRAFQLTSLVMLYGCLMGACAIGIDVAYPAVANLDPNPSQWFQWTCQIVAKVGVGFGALIWASGCFGFVLVIACVIGDWSRGVHPDEQTTDEK